MRAIRLPLAAADLRATLWAFVHAEPWGGILLRPTATDAVFGDDGDGTLTIFDFLVFQTEFDTGCD